MLTSDLVLTSEIDESQWVLYSYGVPIMAAIVIQERL